MAEPPVVEADEVEAVAVVHLKGVFMDDRGDESRADAAFDDAGRVDRYRGHCRERV